MPNKTSACSIDWTLNSAQVKAPEVSCGDHKLHELIREADAVGLDAPFGWPEGFVRAVNNWTSETWSPELRNRLQFRETDRHVNQQVKKWWPLSVSSDRIALPAMRAMALLKHHRVTDKSG